MTVLRRAASRGPYLRLVALFLIFPPLVCAEPPKAPPVRDLHTTVRTLRAGSKDLQTPSLELQSKILDLKFKIESPGDKPRRPRENKTAADPALVPWKRAK